jgi:DNA-3-methyladenine glycosylase I
MSMGPSYHGQDGPVTIDDGRPRCSWGASTPTYVAYHDTEWGFPVVDDRRLFEKLCLEGFQSGLSWITILNKRDRFREVFAGFDYEVVAGFGKADVERLLADPGIVRHRGKIEATINNARLAPASSSTRPARSPHTCGATSPPPRAGPSC